MCDFSEYEIYETAEVVQPAKVRRAEPRRSPSEERGTVVPAPIATERPAPAVAAAET